MGQLEIPSSSKIYIDTVVAIYSVEWNREYFSLLQPLWLKTGNLGNLKFPPDLVSRDRIIDVGDRYSVHL